MACLAHGQDTPYLSIGRDSAWKSSYVWRGMVLDRRSALESSTHIGLGSYYLDIWSTARRPSTLINTGSDEVEYTLGWNQSRGNLSFAPNVTFFTFPRSSEESNTTELGFSAEYEAGQGFALFFNQFIDVHAARGAAFGELGVSYAAGLGPNWEFDLCCGLGWGNQAFNRFNLDVAHAGLNVANAELGLTYRWGAVAIRPSVGVSRVVDRRLRAASEKPDNVVWGLLVGFGG